MVPNRLGIRGTPRAIAVAVGPHFGGTPMTFLTVSVDSDDDARYLARTAERLRSMVESSTGLDGADPVRVRERLEHMDRHARRNSALSHTAA